MTPLPDGFALRLSGSVRRYGGGRVLAGGSPYRVIRLSHAGVQALDALQTGRPASLAARQLAGRLVEGGLASPSPDPALRCPSATVVIPVRDRPSELDHCLQSLGKAEVLVVDDGSAQPEAVQDICRRYGARHLRRARSGGPGAARNDGLAAVDTELVAFVDSDCTVSAGWLERLGGHFADPRLGAVAPRIVPRVPLSTPQGCVRERYAEARSPLDLGPAAGEVGPGRKIAYVPAAALVVRKAALDRGFSPALRYGEDVDLVWRLRAAGWTVRYDPAVEVTHQEPKSWRGLLIRRYHYGTSAAPLSQSHPGHLAPAIVGRRQAAVAALALAGRPRPAVAVAISGALAVTWRLREAGLPPATIPAIGLTATWRSLAGLSRASRSIAGPALIGALAVRRARPAAAVLLAAAPLEQWMAVRPRLDPLRWTAAAIADDLAYGAGVWHGCLRWRTTKPLRVRFARAAASP